MKQRAPIYTLEHGIEVIGEYPATGKNPYARLRIRPHRFFPGVPVVFNGIYVRKSRVLLAAKLGRALSPAEHAHHDDEDRTNDTAENIELLTAAEHNRHHKTGTKHSAEAKQKISDGLKRAYADGRHPKAVLPDQSGASNRKAKLSAAQAAEIRGAAGTQKEIAARFGVSRTTIRLIKNGVTWK